MDHRITHAIRSRAAEDARAFREQYPDIAPNERWLDNSFTAALPLARDDAGVELTAGAHPELFAAYREEVEQILGKCVREDRERTEQKS